MLVWPGPEPRLPCRLNPTDASQLGQSGCQSAVAAAYKYKHYTDIITEARYRRSLRQGHRGEPQWVGGRRGWKGRETLSQINWKRPAEMKKSSRVSLLEGRVFSGLLREMDGGKDNAGMQVERICISFLFDQSQSKRWGSAHSPSARQCLIPHGNTVERVWQRVPHHFWMELRWTCAPSEGWTPSYASSTHVWSLCPEVVFGAWTATFRGSDLSFTQTLCLLPWTPSATRSTRDHDVPVCAATLRLTLF